MTPGKSIIIACISGALLAGCMHQPDTEPELLEARGNGLFIACEGNFQYGNATLSYYDPASQTVENEAFLRANGFKLGDVAQSMTMHGGLCWIVVNNSHVVFAINANNFREVGRIENLTSPRYIHFVSDTKAYITQLWDNRIAIVNPSRYEVTGYITVPGMTMETGSTEQMARWGRYVFVTCWSYQNRILKIDTETDRIVAELTVGLQPQGLVVDCHGRLWATTDGGYEGSPLGYEPPALYRIDPETFAVERKWAFNYGDNLADLQLNGAADTLYWINEHVWRMSVDADTPPTLPFLASRGTLYYSLTVSPYDGDVYVADAVDYQQAGKIYRYTADGLPVDDFYVGITPGAFAWK